MSVVLLLCRLGLAAVFAVAGAGKLADRPGARMAAVDFGAPQALAGLIAIALPLAELVVAGLLLVADTARWAALGAVALLAVFSGAIALALARGREPDCHCFGQLHSEPAGPKALGRNALLGAVAIFVALAGWSDPGPGAFGWIGDLRGAGVLALIAGSAAVVALVGGGMGLVHLMRSYGRALVRLDRVEHALAQAGLAIDDESSMPQLGQAPGTLAPDFALPDTRGVPVTLDDLLAAGKPLLLLFTSPKCGPCAELLPAAAGWQDEDFPLTVALVSGGDADLVRADAEQHQLERVLLDDGYVLSSAYAANGTPSAVIISPERTIASWVASGPDWIRRLVADAEAGIGERGDRGIPVGMPAPQLALADLDGQRVDLSALRGADIALLFWSPGCGHCRAMHKDLLAWEARRPAGATGLVVIASGDVTELRAEGFASPVLLDEGYAAGTAFDAVGTPMAVRLDAAGNVASRVVAGADAVLALVGASPSRPVELTISHVARGLRGRDVDLDLGTK